MGGNSSLVLLPTFNFIQINHSHLSLVEETKKGQGYIMTMASHVYIPEWGENSTTLPLVHKHMKSLW